MKVYLEPTYVFVTKFDKFQLVHIDRAYNEKVDELVKQARSFKLMAHKDITLKVVPKYLDRGQIFNVEQGD